jgi:hypothetical protein
MKLSRKYENTLHTGNVIWCTEYFLITSNSAIFTTSLLLKNYMKLGKSVCCRWQYWTEQQEGVVYDGSENVCYQNLLLPMWLFCCSDRTIYSVRVASSRGTMYQTVKQFEGAGSVCRKRVKGRKHSSSVRAEEVGAAREAITRSQRQSMRYLAQQIGVSNSTACKLCRDDVIYTKKKKATESATVARWHSERDVTLLRASMQAYCRTIRVSWIVTLYTFTVMVALTSKISDLGPQKI